METPLSRFKRADVCFWQFSADERKFLGLRMRFARGNVRDHLDSAKIDHSLRSRAMGVTAVEKFKNQLPRDFSYQAKPAMSPIGTFETCRPALKMSVYWGRPEATGRRSKRRV
jgi:hypothetical protein